MSTHECKKKVFDNILVLAECADFLGGFFHQTRADATLLEKAIKQIANLLKGNRCNSLIGHKDCPYVVATQDTPVNTVRLIDSKHALDANTFDPHGTRSQALQRGKTNMWMFYPETMRPINKYLIGNWQRIGPTRVIAGWMGIERQQHYDFVIEHPEICPFAMTWFFAYANKRQALHKLYPKIATSSDADSLFRYFFSLFHDKAGTTEERKIVPGDIRVTLEQLNENNEFCVARACLECAKMRPSDANDFVSLILECARACCELDRKSVV